MQHAFPMRFCFPLDVTSSKLAEHIWLVASVILPCLYDNIIERQRLQRFPQAILLQAVSRDIQGNLCLDHQHNCACWIIHIPPCTCFIKVQEWASFSCKQPTSIRKISFPPRLATQRNNQWTICFTAKHPQCYCKSKPLCS